MTKGVNKAILLGNLTKNPEVRRSPDGRVVTSIMIATGEEWKDKTTGEKKSKSEFHRIVIFGKLAEIAEQYLKKGAQIYVEGQLQTRKWQDQQGIDRYTTEIIVQGFNGTLQMIGGRQEQGQQQSQYSGGSHSNAPTSDPNGDFSDPIPF